MQFESSQQETERLIVLHDIAQMVANHGFQIMTNPGLPNSPGCGALSGAHVVQPRTSVSASGGLRIPRASDVYLDRKSFCSAILTSLTFLHPYQFF
jgi:hypothetical protein